jgi:hypothetical protein
MVATPRYPSATWTAPVEAAYPSPLGGNTCGARAITRNAASRAKIGDLAPDLEEDDLEDDEVES